MNTIGKLALLCALALAAMAVASASALASGTTTVTPTGAWEATEHGPGNLNNGVLNITCTESTAVGTVDNITTPSRATITHLTFYNCTSNFGYCTVTVTTLPASLNINHVATNATGDSNTAGSDPFGTTGATQTGVATLVDTESATITCGVVTCTATADTTLELEIYNTVGPTPASIHVVAQPVALSGDTGCGNFPGEWNAVWTITSNGGNLVVEV